MPKAPPSTPPRRKEPYPTSSTDEHLSSPTRTRSSTHSRSSSPFSSSSLPSLVPGRLVKVKLEPKSKSPSPASSPQQEESPLPPLKVEEEGEDELIKKEEEVEVGEFVFASGPYEGRSLSSVPRSYISSDLVFSGRFSNHPGLEEALLKNGSLVKVLLEDGTTTVEEGEIPPASKEFVLCCSEGWRVPTSARVFRCRWGDVWITTRDSKAYFGVEFETLKYSGIRMMMGKDTLDKLKITEKWLLREVFALVRDLPSGFLPAQYDSLEQALETFLFKVPQ